MHCAYGIGDLYYTYSEICPILALALHTFGISFRTCKDADRTKLFTGTPYELFTKWLGDALSSMEIPGYKAGDFGTHSFHKGATTYTAGFIGGPSVVSIFLRAGWSLAGRTIQQIFVVGNGET